MNKKTVDLVIMASMFLCLGYTALSGMLMHALHVPMIVFHDLAGFAATILSVVHLVRMRSRIKSYFRLSIAE